VLQRQVDEKKNSWITLGSQWTRVKNIGLNILVLALFFLLWQILATLTGAVFIPKPTDVFNAFVDLLIHGDREKHTLIVHINVSLLRILGGFGLGCITAIPLGLLTGLNLSFYKTIKVLIEPVRFISPIAWVPLSIVLLSGFSRYVFLIWLGVFFPVWVNTMAAVSKVNPVYINVVRVYGAKRGEIIREVIWPSILPDIFTGMRIGIGVGWMCIVAAEMIGGETTGVGRLILRFADLLKLPEVIVGMITIGILGYLMNEILLRIEKRIFKWRTVNAM
jgi:ABC-type nitrate/sulfonate/bicarbonate transport system permease component